MSPVETASTELSKVFIFKSSEHAKSSDVYKMYSQIYRMQIFAVDKTKPNCYVVMMSDNGFEGFLTTEKM